MNPKPLVVRGLQIAYPLHLEQEYEQQLLGLVTTLKSLTTQIILHEERFCLSYRAASRQDNLVDDFLEASRAINVAISTSVAKITKTIAEKFELVKRFAELSYYRSFSHMAKGGVLKVPNMAVISSSTNMTNINLLRKMWIDSNTKLIKDIPVQALEKIRTAIYEAASSGESVASLARRLESIFDMTTKRAKLIARDQIGKLKSNLCRHNDLQHGITHYEWSTCKDGAVRASHSVMQGKICSWLDTGVYKNKIDEPWKKRSSIGGIEKHAGEDIFCRCTNIVLMEMG